jgi:hypothetical protein
MAVKEHRLFNELLENVTAWAMPKIQEDLEREGYQILLKPKPTHKFSPKQSYEYSSYYWCRRLEVVFDRLENIRGMMGRALYKKRGEHTSVLLQEWIVYNYEMYTVVYQGILDIALLLINEIFIMGNPYEKCSYRTVYDNTRINGTGVRRILKKLKKTTSKHREGKNLLVHRGERIKLPLEMSTLDDIDVINMAIKVGMEVSDDLKELLTEFLTRHTRTELITIMETECREIESQVEELFDELLPYYRRMRSFYL